MWAAAGVVEQLLGLCSGAAFPEQLLIVEPPVPGGVLLGIGWPRQQLRVPWLEGLHGNTGRNP